jgi:tetratricopeptide (TPR) repeat protein
MRLFKFFLPISLFYLGVLPSALAQRSSAPLDLQIDVQLRYPDGSPGPRGIHVLLENPQGGVDGDCISVDGGKCRFQPREVGVYIVSIDAGGYVETSERIELVNSRRGFATLTLRKEGDSAANSSKSAAPGGSTSVEELSIPEKARLEYAKGEAAMKANNPTEGAKHFQKAIKAYENYPQAYRMLGEISLEQKDWKAAETFLQKSIELDPKLAVAYVDLGAVRNQTKDYAGAEQALKKGLELNPAAGIAKYELAKTYLAQGRWEDAEPYVKQTIKDAPDLAPAHVLMGNIYLKRRDAASALHEYQEYLRLDPNGAMGPQVQDMVAKLQKTLPN